MIIAFQVCAHYGKVCHPDQRDAESDDKEVQVVAGYLKMFFKDVGSKPSIVDKCYYSVSMLNKKTK